MTDKLKEKIGDWLLDIAKYLMTAVALTSAFKGLGKPFIDNGVADIRIASGDRHYLHSGKYK